MSKNLGMSLADQLLELDEKYQATDCLLGDDGISVTWASGWLNNSLCGDYREVLELYAADKTEKCSESFVLFRYTEYANAPGKKYPERMVENPSILTLKGEADIVLRSNCKE
jgi:hypothetical protein